MIRASIGVSLAVLTLTGAGQSAAQADPSASHRVVIFFATDSVVRSRGSDDAEEPMPSGCDVPGEVCDDGSLYAGDDRSGRPIYFAHNREWESWGNTNWHNRFPTYGGTDPEQRADIFVRSGYGQSPIYGHPVATCQSLDLHGHSDWFLPAPDIMSDMQVSRSELIGFLPGSSLTRPWVLQPSPSTNARYWDFPDWQSSEGSTDTVQKSWDGTTLCVRHADTYGAEEHRIDPASALVGDSGLFSGMEAYRDLVYVGEIDGSKKFFAPRHTPLHNARLDSSDDNPYDDIRYSRIGSSCENKFGGGWTLPSLSEMQLLWEHREAIDHPFGAPRWGNSIYWTSTPDPEDEDRYYAIDLSSGWMHPELTTGSSAREYRVECVLSVED